MSFGVAWEGQITKDKQEMIRNEADMDRLNGSRIGCLHHEGQQPISGTQNRTSLLLQLIDTGPSALIRASYLRRQFICCSKPRKKEYLMWRWGLG